MFLTNNSTYQNYGSYNLKHLEGARLFLSNAYNVAKLPRILRNKIPSGPIFHFEEQVG